jgi:hypothetical protein
MSTIFVEFGAAGNPRSTVSDWMKRARLPLEAWSRRRRWAVASLIAAGVFLLGAYGWRVTDLAGIEAARAALDAGSQRLANARQALAQLPTLRREAASASTARSGTWSSADDVRVVSELAAQNSVALLALEPGAASGAGADNVRPLQLTAHTDFAHLMAFLRGLQDQPVLIVPVDVTVRREASSLLVHARLDVFSALRPAATTVSADAFAADSLDSDDEEEMVFFDPFSLPQMQAAGELPDAGQLRLVGLLHDRTRGLALFDTAQGVTTVEPGEQIGAERVTKLDALGITLAKGGATRVLALTEES